MVPELMEAGSILFSNIFSGLVDGVEELMMPVESNPAIHLGVFNLEADDMSNACRAFSHLRKLKLSFVSTNHADTRAWNERQPSCALRRALRLEVLIINLEGRDIDRIGFVWNPGYEVTAFAMLFHRCKFPSLRNLFLKNVSATADQIAELVLDAPNLHSLQIEACTLHSGLWEDVGDFLKSRRDHGLTTASLNELSKGLGVVDPRHQHYQWVRCLPMSAFPMGILLLTSGPPAVQCVWRMGSFLLRGWTKSFHARDTW